MALVLLGRVEQAVLQSVAQAHLLLMATVARRLQTQPLVAVLQTVREHQVAVGQELHTSGIEYE